MHLENDNMTPLTELIENAVQRIKVNQEWRRITKRVKLSPDDFRRKAEALTNSGKTGMEIKQAKTVLF